MGVANASNLGDVSTGGFDVYTRLGNRCDAMVTPCAPDGSGSTGRSRLAGHLVDGGATAGRTRQHRRVADHPDAREDALLGPYSKRGRPRSASSPDSATMTPRHSHPLAKASAAEGRHGLLVVTPYYSRLASGLVAQFTASPTRRNAGCSMTSRALGVPIDSRPEAYWRAPPTSFGSKTPRATYWAGAQ